MSHVARIPTVGAGAPSVRKSGVATLALVIPLLVAIAAAVALVATGPGASTENTVASDGPRGSDAAPAMNPRSLPLVRPAPTRGSVPVVPERDLDSRAQTSPGLAGKDEAATAAAIGNSGPLPLSSGKDEAATAAAIGNSGPLASSSGKDEAATAAAIGAQNRQDARR